MDVNTLPTPQLHAPPPGADSNLDSYAKPSVAVANEWHDTVILPRRKRDYLTGKYHLVEMGEDPTGSELFPVWGTPLKQLTAFGIGIGLYFRMLVQLGCLFIAFSLVSIPTIRYFISDAYSGTFHDRSFNNATIDPRIWGTAVCTRVHTETLPNDTHREIHDCPVDPMQLYIDLVILGALSLYVIIAAFLQRRAADFIDQQEQTASDYAVVVKDPDADAWDPDEWYGFFSQFGQVKLVTVAVDNHTLLSALAHKRYMVEMLKMESTDTSATQRALKIAKYGPPPTPPAVWKCCLQWFTFYRDLEYWTHELYHYRQYLHTLLKTQKDTGNRVWSVFVMFETEDAQRKCLRETTAGLCATVCDSTHTSMPEYLRFRGTNILRVEEPTEPSSVQWKYVGVGHGKRLVQQIVSVGIVVGLIVGVYHFMKFLKAVYVLDPSISVDERRKNLFILAYALTFTDMFGCKVLFYAHYFEHHQSKEREQLSYLNKLLVFRAFNSAVIIYLLMDFVDVLAPYNLLQIQAILIANLTTTPLLQMLSLYDLCMRKVFGPFAKTQKRLNMFYSGTYWQIAERYTEITKTVGIALFFKPILPTGLVVTSVSMLVNYWVDKYCLLRKWKTPPRYDGLLARASRYHLLLINLVALVMMGHWYNGWPYDTTAQHAMDDVKYQLQEATRLFGSLGISEIMNMVFPFPRRGYVNKQQRRIMAAVNFVIILVTGIAIVWIIVRVSRKAWARLVTGHDPRSKRFRDNTSEVPCSQVKNLNAYIPSYESWYSDFPYLCVDLKLFDHEFITWTGDHSSYCLVNDVTEDSELSREIAGVPLERLFGTCKQYYDPTNSIQVGQATRHDAV